MSESIIAEDHPHDGRQWDCRCARCGGDMEFSPCGECGGDGFTEPGELYEQDPLWYDMDDTEPCHQCGGSGGWYDCGNTRLWCSLHPMIGRIEIESGTPEWMPVLEIEKP